MNGKQIKVEYLLGAIIVLLGIGVGGMIFRPSGEADIIIPARFGDVAFNHELHARMKGIANCTVCHHKSDLDKAERQGATTPKPCKDCHELLPSSDALVLGEMFLGEREKPDYPEASHSMQAYHAKCAGCHVAMGGPTGCYDCHAQKFSGPLGLVEWDHREHSRYMGMDCEDCHHKDEGASESEYRACDQCHKPVKSMGLDMATGLPEHEDTKHLECFSCHTQYNPEKKITQCAKCHENMHVQDGPPSIEEAVHSKCLECHNSSYKDFAGDIPSECDECHKADPNTLDGDPNGGIFWSHTRHAHPSYPEESTRFKCETCHHESTGFEKEPQIACFQCHGKENYREMEVMDMYEVMHSEKGCVGCHAKEGSGPTDFTGLYLQDNDLEWLSADTEEGRVVWPHRSHAIDMAFSCRECHHNTWKKDGVYFTVCENKDNCPEKVGDFQKCINCHRSPGSVEPGIAPWVSTEHDRKEVIMKPCIDCHTAMQAGPTECGQCHVK